MGKNNEDLLRAILTTIARQAFTPSSIAEIVMPKAASKKQVVAYNMCDCTKAQSEIAKTLKLDPGNFSRTIARWADAGIIFRLGNGRDAKLLHVYPLRNDPKELRGDNK